MTNYKYTDEEFLSRLNKTKPITSTSISKSLTEKHKQPINKSIVSRRLHQLEKQGLVRQTPEGWLLGHGEPEVAQPKTALSQTQPEPDFIQYLEAYVNRYPDNIHAKHTLETAKVPYFLLTEDELKYDNDTYVSYFVHEKHVCEFEVINDYSQFTRKNALSYSRALKESNIWVRMGINNITCRLDLSNLFTKVPIVENEIDEREGYNYIQTQMIQVNESEVRSLFERVKSRIA